jgi:uncharacterized protein YlaI
MTAPLTPRSGIRLRGGAPIPPAPSLGVNAPITTIDGTYLGSATELRPGLWVPVCAGCHTRLDPRTTQRLASGALKGHHRATHRAAA